MTSDLCHIFSIADRPSTLPFLQQLLPKARQSSVAKDLDFVLVPVDGSVSAIDELNPQQTDVLLIDLDLDDANGLELFRYIRDRFLHVPLIVAADRDNATQLVKAFQIGADGYFSFENLDGTLLAYEIRLAIERQRYRSQFEQSERQRQQQEQEREFQDLDLLVTPKTRITARMFGAESLRESVPDIFDSLTQSYGELLDLALEQRAYKVEHNLSEQLRALADKLGFLKAGPRDVIELHATTLRQKNQDIPIAKAQAYVAEGRLLVLELMGYLTAFYRKYYIGLSTLNITSRSNL